MTKRNGATSFGKPLSLHRDGISSNSANSKVPAASQWERNVVNWPNTLIGVFYCFVSVKYYPRSRGLDVNSRL